MFLLFDVSEKDVIHLALFGEKERVDSTVAGRNRDLLGAVDNFLRERQLNSGDVYGIAVVVGAGGFSSSRIAAVVANGFAYVKNIPVVAVSKDRAGDTPFLVSLLSSSSAGRYVSAAYSGEPNIGRSGA